MAKQLTVSILGCGSRGAYAYGGPMNRDADKRYKIVSICDIIPSRFERFAKSWGVSPENCFTDENEFLKEKRSDILVIATQDRDHVRQAIKALDLGYDILLEKPISPDKQELLDLLEAQKRTGKTVMVCHVLRYAPAFTKLKELLDSGVIGKLLTVEWIEQVAYWHQAHSFVRGNWRNSEETSPMIMAKCCHDLDLMQYYAGAKCSEVYSVGGLDFFNRANQPEGAADRCFECKYNETCTYSAENIYIKRWKEAGCPNDNWPFNICCREVPNTEENLRASYKENQYGRCVFACDNDVVDNQKVMMKFENGVSICLTMTAFTHGGARIGTFHGTLGEIEFNADDEIKIKVFGKPVEAIKVSDIVKEKMLNSFGHGGGDYMLLTSLYEAVTEGAKTATALEGSVESHLMALAAEESRVTGKVVKVHE